MTGRPPPKRKSCGGHKSKRRCPLEIMGGCLIQRNPSRGLTIHHEIMLPLDLLNPDMCQWMSTSLDYKDHLPQKKGNGYLKRTGVFIVETRDTEQQSVGRSPTHSNKPTIPSLIQGRPTPFMSELRPWNNPKPLTLPQSLTILNLPPENRFSAISKTCQKMNTTTYLTKWWPRIFKMAWSCSLDMSHDLTYHVR